MSAEDVGRVATTATEAKATQALHKALAAFQLACPPIPKGRKATIPGKDGKAGYSYMYAALEDIAAAIKEPLAKAGLSWSQSVSSTGQWVSVTTTVRHEDGASFTTEPFSLPAGATPQSAGSAASYGRRYSLSGAIGIVTEEDDDGAGATHSEDAEQPKGNAKASAMSDAQRSLIHVLAKERAMSNADLHRLASEVLKQEVTTLTVLTGGRNGTASAFIEALKNRPKPVAVEAAEGEGSVADDPGAPYPDDEPPTDDVPY